MDCLNKQERWMSKCKAISRSKLPELPDEIWIQIMLKLPIKSLHICKCVSKTWHSHVLHIFDTQKGLELPPCGILFHIMRVPGGFGYDNENDVKQEFELGYLSLGDYKITKWSKDDQTGSATLEMTDHQNTHGDYHNGNTSGLLLGNLTIKFGGWISNAKKYRLWNMHRGLMLSIVDSHTYHVYNPATNEVFVLPKSPSQLSRYQPTELATIINFSDCLFSTECNFSVISFSKDTRTVKSMVLVEIYSSNKHQWSASEFPLEKEVYLERWNVSGAVFLDSTLYFMTNKRHVVAVQFHSRDEVSLYSIRLPSCIKRGFVESQLDVSQGCLYLSNRKFPNLWIWKHDGRSTDSDPWIPQLIFKKSGTSVCQPLVEKFFRQVAREHISPHIIIIHPEEPVVFIDVESSIFAFHLFNGTVEKIAERSKEEIHLVGTAFIYSPCFASLKRLKPTNPDRCDQSS